MEKEKGVDNIHHSVKGRENSKRKKETKISWGKLYLNGKKTGVANTRSSNLLQVSPLYPTNRGDTCSKVSKVRKRKK
jgi:hypothetical protein